MLIFYFSVLLALLRLLLTQTHHIFGNNITHAYLGIEICYVTWKRCPSDIEIFSLDSIANSYTDQKLEMLVHRQLSFIESWIQFYLMVVGSMSS